MTYDEAIEAFEYDPASGKLFWKIDVGKSKLAGKQAGTINRGYVKVIFRGKHYMAHRLIWLMEKGRWPPDEIDHINGDKADNRLCNLREATRSENLRNRPVKKNNKLGIKGVVAKKWKGKIYGYQATIMFDGKQHYLGIFDRVEYAKEAFDAAAKKHYGEFARG